MSTTFPTVSVDGKALKLSSGDRFMANGVCLQPGKDISFYDYPLSDTNYNYTNTVLLPYLKDLNINMIRVYQIDLTASHDKTMKLLEDNGIYVMLEVENKEICIKSLTPDYNYQLYMRGIQVIDLFQKYPNTLAFSVGNETEDPGYIYSMNNSVEETVQIQKNIAAALKSFIRDLKTYITSKGYRAIPVGVAIRDVFQSSVVPAGLIGTDICAEYYAGGTNAAERADFIGLNTYRYVTAEDPKKDPLTCYDNIVKKWSGMPIPIIFSEIGAISAVQTWKRDWAIITQMYTEKKLYENFSGQIAFSFFNEKNNLGLYIQNEDQSGNFSKKAKGGVSALEAQFQHVSGLASLPIPENPPASAPNPSTCDPALLASFSPPTTSITMENLSTANLVAVQGNAIMGKITGAPSNGVKTPTTLNINTTDNLELFIQREPGPGHTTWENSCTLAAVDVETLSDGAVINNENWEGACKVITT